MFDNISNKIHRKTFNITQILAKKISSSHSQQEILVYLGVFKTTLIQ